MLKQTIKDMGFFPIKDECPLTPSDRQRELAELVLDSHPDWQQLAGQYGYIYNHETAHVTDLHRLIDTQAQMHKTFGVTLTETFEKFLSSTKRKSPTYELAWYWIATHIDRLAALSRHPHILKAWREYMRQQ